MKNHNIFPCTNLSIYFFKQLFQCLSSKMTNKKSISCKAIRFGKLQTLTFFCAILNNLKSWIYHQDSSQSKILWKYPSTHQPFFGNPWTQLLRKLNHPTTSHFCPSHDRNDGALGSGQGFAVSVDFRGKTPYQVKLTSGVPSTCK